jgi:hypothetical protein
MKHKMFILSFILVLFLSVWLPQLNGEQFSYEFTALHNEYKLTNFSIRHTDGSRENCELTVTYYKLSLKMRYELKSERGYTGIIEATTPDDLFLYDVTCAGKKWVSYCDLFDDKYVFGKICDPAFRKMFMDDNKRAALRQEYDALKMEGLDEPPYFRSPHHNSIQTNPGRVKVELFLARKAVTPCKQWSFTVVFDRWDPDQGSNGKWVSGPHSYSQFQGYENEGGGGGCLAEYYFDFKPGKYRVTARAKHKDGRQTPWSRHIEFTVRLPIPKKMVAKKIELTITSPKNGDTFSVGDYIQVLWTSYGINQNVKIGLVQNGNIIALTPPGGTPNDGHFRRPIPTNVSPGTYRLGIATMDDSKRHIVDNIIIEN